MEVITGAMSTLLPKLGDLLKDEYKLQRSVKDEIRFLKDELEAMQTALLSISEAPFFDQQPPNSQEKLWAKEVRNLSYDLEDNIDKFMVRIDHVPNQQLHGLKGFIDRSINLLTDRNLNLLTKAKIRHEIGTDIKDIKVRIREVSERRDRYKTNNQVALVPAAGITVDNLRLSALYKKEIELAGTEKRSSELIGMLMEGDEASKKQLRIVSIAGFGGLGKTTLAKVAYDKLRGKFDCGAFVSVSQRPDIKRILADMLRQLGGGSIDPTCGQQQQIDELRKILQDKMYFIVIDDIWKTSVWESAIKYALIDNECGSRVIITTRNMDVAKKVGGVYKLQPLSSADSRKLFCLRIFGSKEDSVPNELAEVSENILRKCGGVPLAIITIASMLANLKENTLKSWSKVYQTLGSGLEDSSDTIKDMRMILSVSYYDLPPHLKTCMLYLSSYPEDDRISKKELIRKWIGEGFIPEEQGRSFYKVGEQYVNELINRSLIEPIHIKHDSDQADYFRVHDMVLDLITRLSNEDGFLTTLNGEQLMDQSKKIRRLSLQSSNKENVKHISTISLDHVRSLIVSEVAFSLLPAVLSFPVLRLLDLSGCTQLDNYYLKGICNLFLLRYLGLSWTSITEIPKDIRNLQCLQVLDVSGTEVKNLPSTFVQLRQLVCLRVETLTMIPDGFGNLKHLQVLDGTIILESPAMMHNLVGLTELRGIDLRFDEWDESYEKPVLQCLGSLVSLEYLELTGCNGDLGSRRDRLTTEPQMLQNINMSSNVIYAVPSWMSSLSALNILYISLLTLGEEDLHVLGNIPSLSDLHLSMFESTQDRDKKLVISTAYPFLCLTNFEICKTTGVMFTQGAMPKLRNLKLIFGVLETFHKFGDFDFGLENLSSLVHVEAWMGCPKKSEKLRDAEYAIRNKLEMNPKKPALKCWETDILKMHIYFEGRKSDIMKVLTEIDGKGVSDRSIEHKQGRVTVYGSVDPTTIIENFYKAGMTDQLLNYTYSAEEDPNTCSVM